VIEGLQRVRPGMAVIAKPDTVMAPDSTRTQGR
jgi:hypothetical protein